MGTMTVRDSGSVRVVLVNLLRQNQWANLTTIDACVAIDPAILDAEARGTVGTIRQTLWHVINSENHFLAALQGHPDAGHIATIAGEETGDLATLRDHTTRIGDDLVSWAEGVAGDPMLDGEWGDGPYRVPASMFVAQALHHGATHRWQIGEALEQVGVAAPDTDGWSWWESGAAESEGNQ
jgi:uncharacterized damage-inducible protein DinB